MVQALPNQVPPIELELDTLEVWPNQIAALVPSHESAELLALHARLAQALDHLHLPRELRPYRPHVTLARKAQGLIPKPCGAIHWRASSYVLALSDRGYHLLQHYG